MGLVYLELKTLSQPHTTAAPSPTKLCCALLDEHSTPRSLQGSHSWRSCSHWSFQWQILEIKLFNANKK